MGWFGHGIYDGDETQTRHYDFIKWAKIEKDEDILYEWIGMRKTKIPKHKLYLLSKNYELIIKKIGKIPKYWNEDNAIEWQMLLSLFIDNCVKAPKIIYDAGILASEYLLSDYAEEYDYPSRRRRALRNFIEKANKNNAK